MIGARLETNPMRDEVNLIFSVDGFDVQTVKFNPGEGAPALQREIERATHIIDAQDPLRPVAELLWKLIVRTMQRG